MRGKTETDTDTDTDTDTKTHTDTETKTDTILATPIPPSLTIYQKHILPEPINAGEWKGVL